MEGGKIVRFYQFRHLTFQEYLAAVAAAEGHVIDYQQTDTVLTPLRPYLITEEWKEVVPMAAVLAKKRAEPIMEALVSESIRLKIEASEILMKRGVKTLDSLVKLPSPVARLVQCLVEEAQASPATLSQAIESVVYFARGCGNRGDWRALSRGPYANSLLRAVWRLYSQMDWPDLLRVPNTFASIAAFRIPESSYRDGSLLQEIKSLINSDDREKVVAGLMSYVGVMWHEFDNEYSFSATSLLRKIDSLIFNDDPAVWFAASWASALTRHRKRTKPAPPKTLDRFLTLWLSGTKGDQFVIPAFALSSGCGISRDSWKPILTEKMKKRIEKIITKPGSELDKGPDGTYVVVASLMVAFHAGNIFTDAELTAFIDKITTNNMWLAEQKVGDGLEKMKAQMN